MVATAAPFEPGQAVNRMGPVFDAERWSSGMIVATWSWGARFESGWGSQYLFGLFFLHFYYLMSELGFDRFLIQ